MKRIPFSRYLGVLGIVFIALILWSSLREVDVSLIYFWQQSVLRPFGEYLNIPGGISGALAVLFIRQMASDSRGMVAVILLILLVYFALILIFRDRRNQPYFQPVLMAALIPVAILFTYYRLPGSLTLSVVIGYILATVLVLSWSRRTGWNLALTVILGLLSYWMAGSAGLAVVIQGFIIGAISKHQFRSLFLLVPLLCIPLMILPVDPGISLRQSYLGSFIVDRYDLVPLPLFISMGMLICVFGVFGLLSLMKFDNVLHRKLFPVIGVLLVSFGLFFAMRASLHKSERFGYRVLEAGMNEEWNRVLDLCPPEFQLNSLLQYEVNHALLEKGELLERMFSYTQEFGEEGLFPELFRTSRIALQASGFYYDLGFANEVRHWATEAEMGLTYHPVVLRNLIMSYAAKGMYDIAEKYLRVLARSDLYRDWCRNISTMMEQGTIRQHPDIQKFIRNNPRTDFFASASKPGEKLALFYQNNPGNRPAFDYLMAHALIQKNLDYIISLVGDFRKLGYNKLPLHIQEAVCLYITSTRTRQIRLEGYQLDQQVMEDYRRFLQGISNQYDRREKRKNASSFADTYWFYYYFTGPDAQGG